MNLPSFRRCKQFFLKPTGKDRGFWRVAACFSTSLCVFSAIGHGVRHHWGWMIFGIIFAVWNMLIAYYNNQLFQEWKKSHTIQFPNHNH